jgi:hypothetical protein
MANLTLYVDRGPRSELAKSQLNSHGISYDVIDVESTPDALIFLESLGRDRAHYPMPQYYVGETLAFEGFKEVNYLTKDQINARVEEINASN